MSIADQITRLSNAKAAIKTSIENKGVTVGDDVKLDAYPALIDSIEAGGGSGETHINPDFYELRTSNGTNYDYLFYSYKEQNIDFSLWDTSKCISMYYMFYQSSFKSLDLSSFNTSNVKDMSYMFCSCKNLTSLILSNFDTSNIKDMSSMFNNCIKLTSLDLSSFDTSNVTKMNSTFYYCSNLTSLNLSSFNTSNVKDISYMFYNCKNLTSLNLSSFNTSNVTTFYNMFNNCSNLTSLNLSSFNTSNATSVSNMFCNCLNLTTITGYIDLSNLTNGFYPGSSSNPVYGCSKLETLYLKNIYKNITITNASKYSINLSSTVIKDECLIYIISELPDLINDKGLTATDKIILTLPKTNTLTAEQVQPAINKGWTVANCNF